MSRPVIGAGTGKLTFVEAHHDGLNGITGLRVITSLLVSPDGLHLYAGQTSIVVFSRNPANGQLTFVKTYSNPVDEGYFGSSLMVFSPDGNHLYTSGDGLSVFQRDAATGLLTWVETHRNGVNGVQGLGVAASFVISPDGKHVYTGRNEREAPGAVFARNSSNGQLSFVEALPEIEDAITGNRFPGSKLIAISPDGAHVYAVAQSGNSSGMVAILARNTTSGLLTTSEIISSGKLFTSLQMSVLREVDAVALSPDGSHLYTAELPSTASSVFLGVYKRDTSTGNLTFDAGQTEAGLNAVRYVVDNQVDSVRSVDGILVRDVLV